MTTGCAGVQTLLPSENFVSSLTIPNDVLAYSINPVLRGWVTSDGNTTQATADCAAATFHKVIKEYKGDPLYKVELGVGIGVGSALVIGLGAYLAAKHLPRHRASAVGAPAA